MHKWKSTGITDGLDICTRCEIYRLNLDINPDFISEVIIEKPRYTYTRRKHELVWDGPLLEYLQDIRFWYRSHGTCTNA